MKTDVRRDSQRPDYVEVHPSSREAGDQLLYDLRGFTRNHQFFKIGNSDSSIVGNQDSSIEN